MVVHNDYCIRHFLYKYVLCLASFLSGAAIIVLFSCVCNPADYSQSPRTWSSVLPSFNQQNNVPKFSQESQESHESMLDGCYHIFLDIGANWGITTRKLFEPHFYRNARYVKYFEDIFGRFDERSLKMKSNPRYVCSVGFEPNPKHSPILESLETAYQKCGWNARFLTNTALYDQKGNITFYKGTFKDKDKTDVTGSVQGKTWKLAGEPTSTAVSIRLSDFFTQHIINRKPSSFTYPGEKPKVLMKIDTESSEIEILFDLILHGLLTKVNFALVEYHDKYINDPARVNRSLKLEAFAKELSTYCSEYNDKGEKMCDFVHESGDDETFGHSTYPLPICPKQ